MHCLASIEHEAHGSNVSACSLYFMSVARGRAISQHSLFGMGTVGPSRPTVSDVSSDPYQILHVYQDTHDFFVTLSWPDGSGCCAAATQGWHDAQRCCRCSARDGAREHCHYDDSIISCVCVPLHVHADVCVCVCTNHGWSLIGVGARTDVCVCLSDRVCECARRMSIFQRSRVAGIVTIGADYSHSQSVDSRRASIV